MSRPITIFDSERDRLVVHGDTGEAADETWALAFSDPPVWTKLGTGPYHAMGAHDAHGDRIIAVAATHYAFQIPPATWQLQFGEEPTLEVGCPGTQPWSNPGTSLALEYSIVNPSKRPRLVDWTLASERDWPGFPIVGSVDVEGFETAVVPVEFVVPDSAAIGLNRLRFSGREAGEAEDAWFCEHLIGDLATPVLVSALAPEVLADAIVLRWLVADSDGGPLEVERRESAHAWEQVGLANPDGRDRVRYQDSEVDPGHTYTYRLEVPNPAGNTWAGLVEAKLPDIQLNVFVKRVDPVAGSVMLEAELPAPGEVRFEIFDTSGRRVASRSITGWTHGSHTAVLDLHDRSAGVFFVRLTHMGRSAIARFALIR